MTKKSSASSTPAGDFSFDNGISYGDVFVLDAPNGAGIESAEVFSDHEYGTGVPLGYFDKQASPAPINDDFFMSQLDVIPENDRPLNNLEWLELSAFDHLADKDPFIRPVDYLGRPMPAVNRSYLELQSIWNGIDHKSNIQFVDNQDLNPLPEAERQIDWDGLERIARTALENRSSLENIQRVLESKVGDHPRIAAIMSRLEPEYGLAGRVYVTADLHPELSKVGNHEAFKRRFASVRYIVANEDHSISQYHKFLGCKVVPAVPWDHALRVYTPMLENLGKKIASARSSKDALRMAILSEPEQKKVAQTNFPIHAEQRVSAEEAAAALRAAPKAKVTSFEEEIKTAKRRAIRAAIDGTIARMVKSKMLTKEEAVSLADAKSVKEVHTFVADKNRKSLNTTGVHQKSAQYADYRTTEYRKGGTDLDGHDRKMGRLARESKELLNTKGDYKGTVQFASYNPTDSKKSGADLGSHARTLEDVSRSSVNRRRIEASKDKWINHARKIMATGICGKALTSALKKEIPAEVSSVIRDDIIQMRKDLEGITGITHIDAQAFAAQGPSGCKTASVSKTARLVLACSACSTCRYNASGKCSVFNRRLAETANTSMQARIAAVKASDRALVSSTVDAPSFEDVHDLTTPDISLGSEVKVPSLDIQMDRQTIGDIE